MTEAEKIEMIDRWSADMTAFRGKIRRIGKGLPASDLSKLDDDLAELTERMKGIVHGD